MLNNLLANFVFIFHCIIVIFVLSVPFLNNVTPAILILHIVFSISLFAHWYINSNQCSLTILESYLRGKDANDTFTYKFIAPMYDISKSKWNNIVWNITFILMCISLYKLYKTDKFKVACKCYTNEKNWIECIKPLFQN